MGCGSILGNGFQGPDVAGVGLGVPLCGPSVLLRTLRRLGPRRPTSAKCFKN